MVERLGLACFLLATIGACSDDGETVIGNEDEVLPGDATFEVSGTVRDLASGELVDDPNGSITVKVDGVRPAPTVTIDGPAFTIAAPANSTFHLLAGSFPFYRPTYNAAVEVTDHDIDGLELFVAEEAYLDEVLAAFAVEGTAQSGILFVRVVDAEGQPAEGVPADAFIVPEGVAGPFFLDAARSAAPGASATTSSGLVLFANLEPGLSSLGGSSDSGYSLAIPSTPVAEATVSYVQAVTSGEVIVVPQNVSFETDVAPIFESRGCLSCHSTFGIGRLLGGLTLNGRVSKVYDEVAVEISRNHGTPRVDLENPEASLILTMPSFEDPPDIHPFATFTGPGDPDYLTILTWIREGAENN